MSIQSKSSIAFLALTLLLLAANGETIKPDTTTTPAASDDDESQPFIIDPAELAEVNRQSKDAIKTEDYFYDETLSQAEIEEQQKKRKLEEEARLKALTTTTEPPPEWFDKQEENPMMSYIKQECQKYVKKHFEEMSKTKTKSNLNHSMLSVVTLTGFFSLGIFIGLLIVLIKGRTFKKNAKSGNKPNGKLEPKKKPADAEKKAYTSVQQSEQVV
jgi:hypothetical protein